MQEFFQNNFGELPHHICMNCMSNFGEKYYLFKICASCSEPLLIKLIIPGSDEHFKGNAVEIELFQGKCTEIQG